MKNTKNDDERRDGIVEQLRPLAVPIDTLTHDPRNARKHSARNVEAVALSLQEHGQRKPIVVQVTAEGTRVVRAGNGTLDAARKLGWTHLAAVLVEESDKDAKRYALRDNRTAELAEWNDEVLLELLAELDDGLEDGAFDLGWTEREEKMLASFSAPAPRGATPKESLDAFLSNETKQIVLYFEGAAYEDVIRRLGRVQEDNVLASNTDVLLHLLDAYEAKAKR